MTNNENLPQASVDAGRRRRFPTWLSTLGTGVLGFIALLYFQGRGASLWATAACAAFVGGGLALLWAKSAWRRQPSTWLAAFTGALAGLALLFVYMGATNPGACMVAWTQMLAFGGPIAGGIGAAGSAVLVSLLGSGRPATPAPLGGGGERAMLAVLVVAATLCGVAVFPFAQNAVAYSRLLTGSSLTVERIYESRGAGAVVAEDRVLVLQPWLGDLPAVELLYPDGTAYGLMEWEVPERAGGMRIHLDEAEGVAYVSWVEPALSPGQSGVDETWRSVLIRVDVENALFVGRWTFPAEDPVARVALVHGRHAVLTTDEEIICYHLPGQPEPGTLIGQQRPVVLWRGEARGTELTRAAAGTLVVASYGVPPACHHLPTGRLCWEADGEAAAAPVYDHSTDLWIVATRDAVFGLSAGEGAVWEFPRSVETRQGGPTIAGLYACGGQVLVIERNPGPSWDWPPLNVKLTAHAAADGSPLWQTKLERDVFHVVGRAGGVTFLGGANRLLVGIGEGGKRVFRTRAGPVSDVVERPDGKLLLLDEMGGVKVARIR